jgi:hypothetical protein
MKALNDSKRSWHIYGYSPTEKRTVNLFCHACKRKEATAAFRASFGQNVAFTVREIKR